MRAVYVVTHDAGYEVGLIIDGAFSTRQKADEWITAKRAEYAREVRSGNAPSWGGPSYDVEELHLDPAP